MDNSQPLGVTHCILNKHCGAVHFRGSGAKWLHTTRVSGGPLFLAECEDIVDRIKILRQHLFIRDSYPEFVFEKVDQFHDSCGIEDPLFQERIIIAKRRFIVGEEIVFENVLS